MPVRGAQAIAFQEAMSRVVSPPGAGDLQTLPLRCLHPLADADGNHRAPTPIAGGKQGESCPGVSGQRPLCRAGTEEHPHPPLPELAPELPAEVPGNPRLHFLGKGLTLREALAAGC